MADIQQRISLLDALPLVDEDIDIKGRVFTINVGPDNVANYADAGAFECRWTEEIGFMQKINTMLERGEYFVNMVYTYRSCSKALPSIKLTDEEAPGYYQKVYDVLNPEIEKLRQFQIFQRDAVKLFSEHVRRMAGAVQQVYSESFVHCLVRLLDLMAILDALKNMKACLNNDFSFYKRAFSSLFKNQSTEQSQDNHTLYLFLAHQNSITTSLKTDVQAITNFDDVLALIVNQCANFLETERYLSPQEKHCLLRVIPYGLFLMDGDSGAQHNIFRTKKIKLDRFAQIFRRYPVAPLYGDMQITLESMIRRSPHFDEKVWGRSDASKQPLPDYTLTNTSSYRSQHNEYTAKLLALVNSIKQAGGDVPHPVAKEVVSTVLQGLHIISDWSARVMQQSAWKYAHPNENVDNVDMSKLSDYHKAVKLNYNSDEKFALVEMIALIKGLSALLFREESLLLPIIRRSIHDELQEFIYQMREIIRVASRKTYNVRSELLQLRFFCADWANGVEPNDPCIFGKKPEKDEKWPIASRPVGPTLTQLELIRMTVYGFVCHKLLGRKGLYDKELSSDQVRMLQDFYLRSFNFRYLLDYKATILRMTDFADLWYREFYLELLKKTQFKIEDSLPWILTEHILTSHNTSMAEFVFYPLYIYNDAAERAIYQLKQQFLYDEIEAEANLCFSQLLFTFSEQVFGYYKQLASCRLLEKHYRTFLELGQDAKAAAARFTPPKSRIETLLAQRHVELLGRYIDLNRLIAQRINTNLRRNLEHAIARWEASDITGIVELEMQLENIKLTHELLSEVLHIDPFDEILSEVNDSTSLVSFHGRIVFHALFELLQDFFPNFNFNSTTNRFTKAAFSFTEPLQREVPAKSVNPNYLYGSLALNRAYQQAADLFTGFVGTPHVVALVRVIGKANLPLVQGEVLSNIHLKLYNLLVPYVREMMTAMPPSSKLPLYEYGTAGVHGYLAAKLEDVMTYPELYSDVLQHFKEFGNAVVFLNMLDISMVQQECLDFIITAPFLGINPYNYGAEIEENADPSVSSPIYTGATQFYRALEGQAAFSKAPAILKDLVTAAWKADKFYRPLESMSVFKSNLQVINDMLHGVRAEWANSTAEAGSVIPVETTSEFYRLWSALVFTFCQPPSAAVNEGASNLEIYGDGFVWAGCTIIHLLGQELRYNLLDFSTFVINCEEAAPTPCTDATLLDFLRRARYVKDLSRTVFNALHLYLPQDLASPGWIPPPQHEITISYKTTMLSTPQ